ncbi:MAG: hypothetical protein RIT81_08445 [Deltaproteobacteria bacterium]
MQFLQRYLHPPRRAFPTRAGWFVFLSPFVLGTAAITASNNLLFMLLGATLGSIVLSGILSERNVTGVRTRIRPVGPAFAGEPARLEVTLHREDGKTGYAFTVHERPHSIWRPWKSWRKKSPDVLIASVPILERGHAKVIAARRFDRRGPARLARLELSTTFPFDLIHKTRDVDVDVEVFVRPRRIEVARILVEPRSRAGDGDIHQRRGAGLEVYGLRERKEHEDRRRVHARRSMALGRDVIIETAGVERPVAWLGVALEGGDPVAVERTLEHAQAALLAWHGAGRAVGLCIGDDILEPGEASIDRLLDLLARVEPNAKLATARRLPSTWLVALGARAPAEATERLVVRRNGAVGVA